MQARGRGLQGGSSSQAQRLPQALQEASQEGLRHQKEAEVHSSPPEEVRGCVGGEMRKEAQEGMQQQDRARMLACPNQGMRTCPGQEAEESLRSRNEKSNQRIQVVIDPAILVLIPRMSHS